VDRIRSNTGIVGLNSARGMDVSARLCVVLSTVGRGFAMDRLPIHGVIPNVEKGSKADKNSPEAKAQSGLYLLCSRQLYA
jgi:hypothetical protein